MRRVLKTFFSLLAAIVVLGFIAGAWLIHDGDWIRIKTQEFVSGITGRQFSIDGTLVFDLSLHPVVRAEDLRLANPAWAGDTDLVRLQKLRLSIDFLSLFSDQLVFDFIELEGLDLALVENVQGEANWDLFPAKEQDLLEDEPMNHLPVNANRLNLKDIHVIHQAPDREQALDFVLLEFEAERGDDGLTTAIAHGSLNDLPLEFRGRVGPLKHFIIGGGVELKIDLSLGEMTFGLDGVLPDPQTPDKLSANVQLQVPSLQKIPFYPQSQNLPDLPGRLSGHVDYAEQLIRLTKVTGSVADSKFDLDALLKIEENFAGSFVEFEISGPDFRPLLPIDAPAFLPGEFRASGRIEKGAGADQLKGLELDLGKMRARVSGTVDDLTNPGSVELEASISLPSLAALNGLVDQVFPEFPFTMDVSLNGNGGEISLDPLQLKLGPNDLAGKISVDLQDKPVLTGQLHSDFLDLAWLQASDTGTPATTTSSERVFPDEPIPYAEYGQAQVDLGLSVDRIKLHAFELQELAVDLSLGEDHFRLDSFEFGGPLGETLSGKLAISDSEAETLLEFEMEGDELRLGLANVEGQDVSTYPPTSISMEMSGKGSTWHQLVSSLDGRIRIIQGKGLIANAGLELLFSDLLSELFNTLNPFAQKSVYSGLECAVVNAVIDSGKVLVDPIIFHTEQITILSGGQIDLETEKIDLEFQTKVRKGIGISTSMVINPFIKLGGTLAAPTIELDPAGVAFAGTVAVATAGLSLIGKSLFDRFLGNTDPCGQALERLDKAEKN